MANYMTEPEPGFVYLEQAFPGLGKNPKSAILKIVRHGGDDGEKKLKWQVGEMVIIASGPGVMQIGTGVLCYMDNIVGRVVKTEGKCEFTISQAPKIVGVDPELAARIAEENRGKLHG